MAVERVYGVAHGAAIAIGREIISPFKSSPGLELRRELRNLPPGTRVGIESSPEFHTPDGKLPKVVVDDATVEFEEAASSYWQDLHAFCSELCLDVVYLENFGLYVKQFEKTVARDKIGREAQEFQRKNRVKSQDLNTPEGKKLRDMAEAYWAANVEADYVFEVERHDDIVKRIKDACPDVVIVGVSHGDLIALNPNGLDESLSPTYVYKREFGNVEMALHYEDIVVDSYFVDEEPNPKEIIERELAIRKYNAATQWRINPEEKPDFIGTFMMPLRNRGLFEVYLDPDGKTATIIDCLGTARAVITRNDRFGVSFVKTYDLEKSDTWSDYRASGAPIAYEFRKIAGTESDWYGHFEAYGRFQGKAFMFTGSEFNRDAC